MDDSIIERILDSPAEGRVLLSASLRNFISFFFWYMYRQNFIFKPFHKLIIQKLEDIAFGRAEKKNLIINLPPRMGKLIADDTPVLTSSGWKRHGDLRVGDYVIGIDGKFKRVLAISPKAEANCCVEFSDGDKIYCHENHEWVIHRHSDRKTLIRETKWFETVKLEHGISGKRGHRYEYQLPEMNGILGTEKALPVKPYSLGAWLGDGTNTKPWITGDKNDYPIIAKMISDGYENYKIYVHKTTGVYGYVFKGLKNDLNRVDMCHWRKKCKKYIPEEYLTASEKQRLELLAGLLDTDGHLTRDERRYHFTTADESLRDSFIELISTFGWRVSVLKQEPRLSSSGIQGKHAYWIISFNPDRYIPCQLERKQLREFSKKRKIAFTSVTKGNYGKIGNCIEVEDGIYLVGKRLKPTHNSAICQMFCAWSYMINSHSNCIYTSYSDDLTSAFSKDIRSIIESEAFKKLTGIQLNKAKSGADYWATTVGGGFRAASMGGSITGFGCFSYGTIVKTDQGDLRIGDIVENKMNVRLKSFNLKSKRIEFKKPSRFIKNDSQEFLRIILNDGKIIDCSTDHLFYTKEGIKRADELTTMSILPSNSLDNIERYSKFFHYLISRIIFIADKLSLFLCGNVFVNRDSITSNPNSVSFSTPKKSGFYIGNIINRCFKLFRNFFVSSCVGRNLLHLFYCKPVISVMSSVSNAILFVFRLCAISKIFKSVVSWISVKMTNYKSLWSFTNKRFCDKRMNSSMDSHSIFSKVNIKIPLFGRPRTQKFVFSNASGSSDRGDFINSLIFTDRKPLLIYRIGHFTSYCFTIPSNHNFFLGGSQQLLVRNCGVSGDEFGGALIIDDPNKASSVKSQAELQNTVDYYNNTLKSRLNNQKRTPIIVIMQRLGLEDLTGYLLENEKDDWDLLKLQGLDEDTGKALWEEKYPASELLKLKNVNPFVYYGQYQQEPIVLGGSVIKTEWFRYYNPKEEYQYQFTFVTSDTAQKKGEANDFTVFSFWGKTFDNRLHLIDMVRGKFEADELRAQVKLCWQKWNTFKCPPYGFYIEDKSSGIGVLQEIKKTDPIPLIPIARARYKNDEGKEIAADKFSRVMTTAPYLANGWVYLPNGEKDDISSLLLAECAAFKADLSHKHDDMCFVDTTMIATIFGRKLIKDVRVGDWVITPTGINRVIASKCTGVKKTISKFGITATPNHKFFTKDGYKQFDTLDDISVCDKLSLGGLLKWRYKRLLNLMGSNINLWGREGIIFLSQRIMLNGGVLKDFMLRFGNFIRERKFLKAMSFITKTTILLTTTFLIWSVYQGSNILICIKKTVINGLKAMRQKNILRKFARLLRLGTQAKREENGTAKTQKNNLKNLERLKPALNAEESLKPVGKPKSAIDVIVQTTNEKSEPESNPVYNLTIANDGVYYANGILVSNCDTLCDAVDIAFGASGVSSLFI